jgi:hypothetical protein
MGIAAHRGVSQPGFVRVVAPRSTQGTPTTKPDKPKTRHVTHFKEITIYLPPNTAVTIVVMSEEKPEVEEQDDHWEDERQQMLDDYD